MSAVDIEPIMHPTSLGPLASSPPSQSGRPSDGGPRAQRHRLLAITSVLCVFLSALHVADDIVRGFEKGGVANLAVVPIFAVWLYGALILGDTRFGYTISFLGSLLSLAVPLVHMTGRGVGGEIARSSGGLLFIWTILALGAAGLFSAMLAVHGLWRPSRPGEPRLEMAAASQH